MIRSLSREGRPTAFGPPVRIGDPRRKAALADFASARYLGLSPEAAAEAIDTMTFSDMVTLDLEMRRFERDGHSYDYDPFAGAR